MSKLVTAHWVECWQSSLHPRGPKINVRCGNCFAAFSERPGVHGPIILGCPYCGAANRTGLHW